VASGLTHDYRCAISIGAVDLFAACRAGFTRYYEINANDQQRNRNEKEKILYTSEHCNLHRSFVSQKNIQPKQNYCAADHEETGFDSRDDHTEGRTTANFWSAE